MIQDFENKLSSAQAITSTAVSTNVIDLGAGHKGVSGGRLVVHVLTDFDSAGDTGTLTIALQADDAAGMASPVAKFTSATLAQSALVAGAKIVDIEIPRGFERYARLNYTVASGPFTAGTLDAAIVWEAPDSTSYADARRFA